MPPKKKAKTGSDGENDPEDYESLTVVKLREILKERGLSTSGVKSDLVQRLQETCKKSGEAANKENLDKTTDVDIKIDAEQATATQEKTIEEEGGDKDVEDDAPPDSRPRLPEPATFLTPDTTLNIMPSMVGGILMTLSEGGLQYLLAGARASVGIKSGRYMFEVKIVESLSPNEVTGPQRGPQPKHLLRVGLSTFGSAPLIGDTEESISFDSEGNFMFNKKRVVVAQKFSPQSTIAVVLNLDEVSSNAHTVSLFYDGVRAAEPQPIPEPLRGKTLYPTVSFKNLTVHVNFGPEPHAPIPFACRMVNDAALNDVEVTRHESSKTGQHEVLFPICLPDEGAFEWCDWFKEKSPRFTELSDRMIVEWAVRSNLWRPKIQAFRNSMDKPEMNFGIPQMDDGSVRQLLYMVAPVQQRDFIVMEVKNNLTKEERMQALQKFRLPHFKKVALVMLGEPENEFKKSIYDGILREKQEKIDAEFSKAKQEQVRKMLLDKRAKEVEKSKRREDKIKKKRAEIAERKRKREEEQDAAKKDAAEGESKGEDDGGPTDAADGVDDENVEVSESEEEDEKAEESDSEPPKAELTEQEKRDFFKRLPGQPNDLLPYILNTSFASFTLPDADEGFDEIRFVWSTEPECKELLRKWVLERKLTTRIEDLQPSDWFREKWSAWQKDLQTWHVKHMETKDPTKRAAAFAKAKEKEEKKEPPKESVAKTGEDDEQDKEKDAMQQLEEEMERADLDVFGVDDICDIGSGEPLFANFAFEDWALLSLRYELHLLVHAFRHDCNDPERTGIHPEHLAFYYNKYYKKGLNPKNYGVDTVEDLVDIIKDTVLITARSKIVESQLIDDLETNDIFIKLTEEARRDRQRRMDAGDETAQLKFQGNRQDQGVLGFGGKAARPVGFQQNAAGPQGYPPGQVVAPRPLGNQQKGGYKGPQQWSPWQQAPRNAFGMKGPMPMGGKGYGVGRGGAFHNNNWWGFGK